MTSENSNPRDSKTLTNWQANSESSSFSPISGQKPGLAHIPLKKAVFRLALPAVASMMFIMVFNLVDAWWVGKLGAVPLAGVSAAAFLYWALESVGTLASTGVTAMVARFVGAEKLDLARKVSGQGILLAIILGAIFGALTLVFQNSILSSMGLEGEVKNVARQYIIIIAAGLFILFVALSIEAVFRGIGDTRTPMKIMSGALTLNAVLDPFFIFGIGPFPRLEAAGAALATVVSHAIAAAVGLVILQRSSMRLKMIKRPPWIDFKLFYRISRIGAPIAFSGVMFSVSYMFLARIISRFGAEPLAAIGLGHRIEGLAFFTAVGFEVAATTLVGQNLGTNNPERAEKSAWLALLYASLILGLLSVLYFLFSKQIIQFFINDPRVIEEGSRYLKIIAIFEIFLAFEVVLQGAFSGAGNSVPPMVISVPLTWVRIPLGILLAYQLSLGSDGIWWAISVTTGLKGVLMAIWFKSGRWKTKQV